MSRLSDPRDPDAAPLPPVTPHRAICNRAVLETAVRNWERRPPREVRREQRRTAA
jgi:hypothetical protein